MKVCYTSEIFTFQKTLILQLQLTLELSQFQEILSTYTDFLFLFAEYPYFFKFFKNEPNSLQGKNALFKNRFITQDPARDGWNWYGYCGNNPISFIDLSGLEAGDLFETPDDAAKDFAKTYNDDSIKSNLELGAYIRTQNGKYFYDIPVAGNRDHVKLKRKSSENDIVAMIHTHGAYFKPEIQENGFLLERALGPSNGDIEEYRTNKLTSYIVVPTGEMFVIDGINSKNEVIIGIFKPVYPSDPNCPKRKNNIDYKSMPDNFYKKN